MNSRRAGDDTRKPKRSEWATPFLAEFLAPFRIGAGSHLRMALVSAGTLYFIHPDHLGTPQRIAEANLVAPPFALRASEAHKRVIAWQLIETMREKGITKKEMAAKTRTSRSQLDRLVDPENAAVHLETITRAAKVIGKRIRLQMVDAA
jgi:antitoxin HicB